MANGFIEKAKKSFLKIKDGEMKPQIGNIGKRKRLQKRSGGFMLIEVLVSILIFALGMVALVGLQARSLVTTTDVQFRAEAVHLANAYLGEMWASGLAPAALKTAFESGGANYINFNNRVVGNATFPGIPGARAPTVTITNNTQTILGVGGGPINTVDVTITIAWADKEDDSIVHQYTQTSAVGY